MKKKLLAIILLGISLSFADINSELDEYFEAGDFAKLETESLKHQENGKSNYYLGYLAENGIFGGNKVGKDTELAKKYYQKAISLGDLKSPFQLGALLLADPMSFDQGVKILEEEALKGNDNANLVVGYHYLLEAKQKDLIPDIEERKKMLDNALSYISKAVDSDNPDARDVLGKLYLEGIEGVLDPDTTKAIEYFEKNIDFVNKKVYLPSLGQMIAIYNEGKILPKDEKKVFDLYALGYSYGFIPSLYVVGMAQREGKTGHLVTVEKNLEGAFENLFAAANMGNTDAMFRVAEMYFQGEGTRQSDIDAYVWMSVGESLNGMDSKLSDEVLNLIPKRQQQLAKDNRDHLLQIFKKILDEEKLDKKKGN